MMYWTATATAFPQSAAPSSTRVLSWSEVRAFNERHMGRLITDEINTDAAEIAALRRALEQVARGERVPLTREEREL